MRTERGFSVIEALIVVAILAILLVVESPALILYVQNARLRDVADEMRDGLQSARLEAIRRNAPVNFVANNTTYSVIVPGVSGAPDVVVLTRPAMARENLVVVNPPNATVSFNGSGRSTTLGGATFLLTTAADACKADGGNVTCLRVTVAPGGSVRLCNPAIANTDPQGCTFNG